jgi:putative peptidoglycan lipid II flippase
MVKPIRLVSGFVTVGFWTLLSRILGFVRDILIAAFMGAGPVAEAFLVAFSLPNMFRRFFAEGAFNTAFVPMFAKKLESGEDAKDFARDAFSGLAAVLIVLTVVAIIFMPCAGAGHGRRLRGRRAAGAGHRFRADRVRLHPLHLARGTPVGRPERLRPLRRRRRSAASAEHHPVLALVLAERDALPQLAIDISSVESAEGLMLRHGTILTWGVLVAGLAQLALVWVAAARSGYALVPRIPRLTPDMKRLAIIALPAMLAGGVVQINLLVGRQVGSFFDGAIAWLSFADRLYQLPLGVVGIAVGVVLLPDLSRRLRAGDAEGGRDALSRAGEISMALTVPAAVALVVMPVPIVSVLFERGAFGPDDTVATALALAVYGVGLPAFVLQKVLQPLYFARENTKTPFRYALVAMVVNAVAAIGFALLLGFIGAAIGTTLAAWTMVWLLLRGRRSMGRSRHSTTGSDAASGGSWRPPS